MVELQLSLSTMRLNSKCRKNRLVQFTYTLTLKKWINLVLIPVKKTNIFFIDFYCRLPGEGGRGAKIKTKHFSIIKSKCVLMEIHMLAYTFRITEFSQGQPIGSPLNFQGGNTKKYAPGIWCPRAWGTKIQSQNPWKSRSTPDETKWKTSHHSSYQNHCLEKSPRIIKGNVQFLNFKKKFSFNITHVMPQEISNGSEFLHCLSVFLF